MFPGNLNLTYQQRGLLLLTGTPQAHLEPGETRWLLCYCTFLLVCDYFYYMWICVSVSVKIEMPITLTSCLWWNQMKFGINLPLCTIIIEFFVSPCSYFHIWVFCPVLYVICTLFFSCICLNVALHVCTPLLCRKEVHLCTGHRLSHFSFPSAALFCHSFS